MGSSPDGVEDRALAEEIVLLGELMAAAAGQEQHLSQAQVDELLGVRHPGVHEVPEDERPRGDGERERGPDRPRPGREPGAEHRRPDGGTGA